MSDSEYTYEQIKHMTVAQLRDLASDLEHPAVKGYSQLRKDDLIPAVCTALGIEAHAHHEVQGLDKAKVKQEIRALKARRSELLESGDKDEYKLVLRKIHHLKHELRRATV